MMEVCITAHLLIRSVSQLTCPTGYMYSIRSLTDVQQYQGNTTLV